MTRSTRIRGSRAFPVVLRVILAVSCAVALSACLPTRTFKPSNPPNNAQDPDFSWYVAPAAQPGKQVLIGLTRAGPPDPLRPALLLIHGSDGLNRDYMALAREFRATGFDVAIGCWRYEGKPVDVFDPVIQCPLGPSPPGVSEAAAYEVDQLVNSTRSALASPNAKVTVIGFSRGGGVAALRNSLGRAEPTVSVAGVLQGTTAWGGFAGEVDVTARAGTFVAPQLILHGEADALIPVAQAQAMELALQSAGKTVASKYYPGLGHGLMQEPSIRADIVLVTAAWALDPLAGITDVSTLETRLSPEIIAAVRLQAERHGPLQIGSNP